MRDLAKEIQAYLTQKRFNAFGRNGGVTPLPCTFEEAVDMMGRFLIDIEQNARYRGGDRQPATIEEFVKWYTS